MTTAFGFVVGLLQAALLLLGFVQANPQLPQAQKDTAVQVAQQAITTATNVVTTNPSAAPSIRVTAVHLEGPATITVSYSNLPARTSALAVCLPTGKGCTEWVENFRPSGSSGTYVMSAQKAFGPSSAKGLSNDPFQIVVIGSSFKDQIVASPVFDPTAQSVSVSGMSRYTDPDFGFSFWYPSDWKITMASPWVTIADATVIKTLGVGATNPEIKLSLVRTDRTITDTGGAGPFGPISYWFDASSHTWMMNGQPQSGAPSEGAIVTKAADVSINTMGELHMFGGTSRFDTNIIPLSAHTFVVVSDGGGASARYLASTITATDPSVATPVSADEQIKIIRSEKDAYAAQ